MRDVFFGSESNGPDNQEIMARAIDSMTGIEVKLISCPAESIGGDGPVFEHLDSKTIYAMLSLEYVTEVIQSSEDEFMSAVQYGMMMGDTLRRGIYYAQSMEQKKNKKKKKNNKKEEK